MRAGLGHRRSTQRRAADATLAVEQARADIADVRRDGAPTKHHLEKLGHRAASLRVYAEPTNRLDIVDEREIRQLDQIIDAADTYKDWVAGRPVPTARLTYAVEVLTEVAHHSPAFARRAGEPDRTHWYRLLDLAPTQHVNRDVAPERCLPEIGLER
jgi:hypothetical protein